MTLASYEDCCRLLSFSVPYLARLSSSTEDESPEDHEGQAASQAVYIVFTKHTS
jgi:hypothetical protein